MNKKSFNGIYIYTFKFDDGTGGTWRCKVKPEDALIELEKRFLRRRVIGLK